MARRGTGKSWRDRKYGSGEHRRISRKTERMEQVYEREAWCPKVTYPDKRAALLALRKVRGVRRHEGGERSERTVYRCPRCDLFHLTSQGKRKGAMRHKGEWERRT